MATDLNLRLWWDGRDNAARFLDLVDAVAGWPQADPGLQGLDLRDGQMHKVAVDGSVHTPEALRAALTRSATERLRYATGLSMPLWRFAGTTASPGHVRLGIEGWGAAWRPERDRRVEGDANVWAQTVGPFVALLGDSEDERRINAHVEENLERLLSLCQHLIHTVTPSRMLVTTDAGLAIPLNAHLAWYSAPTQVLDDLAWLQTLWTGGLPAYQVPPLRDLDTPRGTSTLHAWRSGEQRTGLWQALGRHLDARPTVEDVAQTLRTGAFDYFEADGGFLLLDYPHPFNAFLDRFYLAVLERAAARG